MSLGPKTKTRGGERREGREERRETKTIHRREGREREGDGESQTQVT